jgi:hypothetical protein
MAPRGATNPPSPANFLYRKRFLAIILAGLFMVIFALLRLYHWNHQDVKLVAGLGLILIALGLDFHIRSQETVLGITGLVIAWCPVLVYYFAGTGATDLLVLIYTAGLIVIIADIILAHPDGGGLDEQLKDLADDIKTEIRLSVKPEFLELTPGSGEIADFATDIWRLEKRLGKISQPFPEDQRKTIDSAIQRLKRILTRYDVEAIDYTGKKYNEGLNADVLSIERDASLEEPVIRDTVEPSVICKGKVIRKGKVIVAEK